MEFFSIHKHSDVNILNFEFDYFSIIYYTRKFAKARDAKIVKIRFHTGLKVPGQDGKPLKGGFKAD